MQTIPVGRKHFARVDDEDLCLVRNHTWYPHRARQARENWYAFSTIDGRTVYMHRLIMAATHAVEVDHRDHDGLNNTRMNLRACTKSQNNANRLVVVSKVGFRGVCCDPAHNRYRGRIQTPGGIFRSRYCRSPEEAAYERDLLALKHFGEFAVLNFPELRATA